MDHCPEDSYFKILDPILDTLEKEKIKEKTIVYVALKWCGQLHHWAKFEYNIESSYHGDELGSLVSQYQSPQSQLVRNQQQYLFYIFLFLKSSIVPRLIKPTNLKSCLWGLP